MNRFLKISLSLVILLFCSFNLLKIKAQEIVSSFSDFENAIENANDGDVILVGDIEFPSQFKINLSKKTLTIKGAYTDKNAVFDKALFLISSNKETSEKSQITFEQITFDGKVKDITSSEIFYNLSNEIIYEIDESDNSSALKLEGNLDVNLKNCSFCNYYNAQGSVIYASYKDVPSEYLNIEIENCEFFQNKSVYDGGAIYLSGNSKNITLDVKKCQFLENSSCQTDLMIEHGGGAIYLNEVNATFNKTTFSKNVTQNIPKSKIYLINLSRGGAIYAKDSNLEFSECIIQENLSSFGGAIYVVATPISIDASVIKTNRALYGGGAFYLNNEEEHPVTLVNSKIMCNTGSNTGGFFYATYDEQTKNANCPIGIYLCTIVANEVKRENVELLKIRQPYDLQNVDYKACLIVDDYFDGETNSFVTPSLETKFNYMISCQKARELNLLKENDFENILNHLSVTDFIEKKLMVKKIYNEELEKVTGKKIVGELTVGANYRKEQTIFLKLYGSTKEIATYHFGEDLILPIPEREGFKFLGWYALDKKVEKIDLDVLGAHTLEASWEVKKVYTNRDTVAFTIGFSVFLIISTVGIIYLVRLNRKNKKTETTKSNIDKLSTREKEVFDLILKGYKRSDITQKLYLSEDTIKKTISNIYKKFDVANRNELLEKINVENSEN